MTKKPDPRILDYLEHIQEAIERASRYVNAIADLQTFERQEKEQDAVVRCITIIGEAATKMLKTDPDFIAEFEDIPWEKMSAMRNRVVHDYFEVDTEIVWKTVCQDFPELEGHVKSLLDRFGSTDSQE